MAMDCEFRLLLIEQLSYTECQFCLEGIGL